MGDKTTSHRKIPIIARHMLQSIEDTEFASKVAQYWFDPGRGSIYDKKFSELLSALPKESVPGIAETCERYIRAWGSGGGRYKVERCVKDAATTDFPRILAVNIYRALQAIDVDKTEAFYLISSILEESMGQEFYSDIA